ncbi:protoporphyrinogen oxidase [Dietzia kunjamensis]|uniref:protoporphyrinogen oxidase n=1 Tax=Dietzia kunjamensis TaxID=322509 RepID=UPI0022769CDF|nr:protoporphyrinogen oxidase [Dietzia kunjamensis]MDJ0423170.1 protoporphyrinogen oxidase [Dietzia kunjamensis]
MGPRVAVVGGGLSGLTAAYQLSRELPDAHITVLEASDRPGGALHTVDFPSGPMELGAEAFIGRRPEASDLVAELGLTGSLRHPGPLGPAILTGGRMVPMPVGTLMGLPSDVGALADVLSPRERAAAAREADLPLDWEPGGDVSLGSLVSERFGHAVVARLVDPMLGGVYAAPSTGLGLRQVIPGLAQALDRGAPSLTAAARELVAHRVPGPVFATLDGGYRLLVDALVRASGAVIRTHATCTALHRDGSGYSLAVAGDRGSWSEEADLVVVAVPVPHAAPLLEGAGGLDAATRGLSGIRTASSAVVALEVDRSLDLPERSGVLVATDEPVPFKAMTFTSRKWPHLDTRPGHLVRVSFGRIDDDEVLAADDATLTRMAESALGGLCGSAPTVLHSRVRRWSDALAEIGPGHDTRISGVRAELAERLPGVELVGGATEGVGVPACIGSARAAARRLASGWQD